MPEYAIMCMCQSEGAGDFDIDGGGGTVLGVCLYNSMCTASVKKSNNNQLISPTFLRASFANAATRTATRTTTHDQAVRKWAFRMLQPILWASWCATYTGAGIHTTFW